MMTYDRYYHYSIRKYKHSIERAVGRRNRPLQENFVSLYPKPLSRKQIQEIFKDATVVYEHCVRADGRYARDNPISPEVSTTIVRHFIPIVAVDFTVIGCRGIYFLEKELPQDEAVQVV